MRPTEFLEKRFPRTAFLSISPKTIRDLGMNRNK